MSAKSGTSDLPGRPRRRLPPIGEALAAIAREGAFDNITVRDVLSRAGLERPSIYAAETERERGLGLEAFLAGMDAILSRSSGTRRLAPVEELCRYLSRSPGTAGDGIDPAKAFAMLNLNHRPVARLIQQRMAELRACRHVPAGQRAPMSHAFAGALLFLLAWWIDRGQPLTPLELDDLYHSIQAGGHRDSGSE